MRKEQKQGSKHAHVKEPSVLLMNVLSIDVPWKQSPCLRRPCVSVCVSLSVCVRAFCEGTGTVTNKID